MVRQVRANKAIETIAFAALSLVPSNLDTDLMTPAGRLFRRPCWPPNQRPTIQIDGGDRGLSIETLFITNAKEEPPQSTDGGGYLVVRWLMFARARTTKKSVLQPLLAVHSAELEPQEPHHLRGT